MNLNGAIQEFVTRKDQISTATVLSSGRRKASEIAEQMSNRGKMAAAAEWCNEAVAALIHHAYEQDDCGYCNIDHTGVFERFAMPWGRFYARWGLRSTERLVLKLHVKRLMQLDLAPLWTYDDHTRRWACNIFDYPSRNDALIYWKQVGELSANDYKLLFQKVQNQ